jgi:hypothetical protein
MMEAAMQQKMKQLREAAEAVKDLPPELRPAAFEFLLRVEGAATQARTPATPRAAGGQRRDAKRGAPKGKKPEGKQKRVGRRRSGSPRLVALKISKPDAVKFAAEKNPKSHQERYAVATAYLNSKGLADRVSVGHMYTFYRKVGWPLPTVLDQVFRDAKNNHDWFTEADEEGLRKLTDIGEDLVRHDLPRKTGN